MSKDKVANCVADAIADMQAPIKLPRRFYKEVRVVPCDGMFTVLLDERAVRTPGGQAVELPTERLAHFIAQEWQAQTEEVNLAAMPMTKLANAACEGVRGRDTSVRADVVKYAGSDLLCYRADHPQELINRQAEIWDPVLTWAQEMHGIEMKLSSGIVPVRQSDAALAVLESKIADGYGDAFALAALHVVTTLCGSALLAFAHGEGQLSAEDTWVAAHVDEDWQIEKWGVDQEASIARAARKIDMMTASQMLDLVR